jgi:hypothetical protein
MPAFPSLSKKTKEIFALRELHAHKFTAEQIRSVLPALKNLLNAEKTAQAAAEKALDEERNALLKADPDEPAPLNSAPQVQIEMDRYRQVSEKTWFEARKAIGDQKCSVLQSLIGRATFSGMSGGGFGSLGGASAGNRFDPFGGGAGIRSAPQPPSKRQAPVSGETGAPVAPSQPTAPAPLPTPGGSIEQESLPIVPNITEPLVVETTEVGGVFGGQATTPTVAEPVFTGQATTPAPQPPARALRGTAEANRLTARSAPLQRYFSNGPTLTLKELVELLEVKAASMRSR